MVPRNFENLRQLVKDWKKNDLQPLAFWSLLVSWVSKKLECGLELSSGPGIALYGCLLTRPVFLNSVVPGNRAPTALSVNSAMLHEVIDLEIVHPDPV